MKLMKKFLILFVIIGLLFGGYFYVPAFAAQVNRVLYQSPCDSPRTFSIGTIDPRFNLTKTELIQDAQQAGSVWKNNNGVVLVQYDPTSKLTLNMVYDQRQALNTQINNLNNQVDQQKDTLTPRIADYEKRAAIFKQKSADLNSQIDYWNSQGGAPKEEYDKLVAQQKALQDEAAQLQQMAQELNQSTDTYNTQVRQLDQKVDDYNTTLLSKPEEGLYVRDGNNEKIDIYFNNSKQELIHTIAHEMGHALGLGHNHNVASIMYPLTNEAVTPSSQDETALAQVCKKQNIFYIAYNHLSILASQLKQTLMTSFNHASSS